ncbi:MAG: retroviral-like aspartic protease family protein [Gemmatimonadaceae bacterium]
MSQVVFGRLAIANWILSRSIRFRIGTVVSFLSVMTGCVGATGGLGTRVNSAAYPIPDVSLLADRSPQPAPGPALVGRDPARDEVSAAWQSEIFWSELAELRLSGVRGAARSKAEIGFAEGIALLAAGDYEKAESAFVAAKMQKADVSVAIAAEMMLANTLAYQRKWMALSKMADSSQLAIADMPTTDALEHWGRAFANVATSVTTFPEKPVAIPLRLTALGTPTIHVRLNGKDYDFWLDTGSSITVLSSEVAKTAGVSLISMDTLTVRAFAGTAAVRPAVVKRLEIGSIVIANSPAVVMQASLMRIRGNARGGPPTGIQIDGIIGWDTIRQFDLSMDFGRRLFVIARPRMLGTSGTSSQNLTWLGKPFVEVHTKGGATLHFTLDTGAQGSLMNASVLEKTDLTARKSKAQVFGIGGTGTETERVVSSLELDIAGTPVQLASVMVYGPIYSSLINCDGVLGIDVAQFGTIRIDATNGLFSIGSDDTMNAARS